MRRLKLFAVLLAGMVFGVLVARFDTQTSARNANLVTLNSVLTPAQLTTLKNDIAANADTKDIPKTSDGAFQVAAIYNVTATPDFWVWRTFVTKDELVNSTSVDATTFNWTGTGFITRSQGERDAWRELFGSTGAVNASLPQVRQAFADIFSGGTAPAPANRTHLLTVARRKCTRIERLYAGGTGSTASPGTMVVEGELFYQDVLAAWNQP